MSFRERRVVALNLSLVAMKVRIYLLSLWQTKDSASHLLTYSSKGFIDFLATLVK